MTTKYLTFAKIGLYAVRHTFYRSSLSGSNFRTKFRYLSLHCEISAGKGSLLAGYQEQDISKIRPLLLLASAIAGNQKISPGMHK